MSKDNFQNYYPNTQGGQYQNQQQQPYQPQPDQYGQVPMTNPPADPNQPPQNYYQPPQNYSNAPPAPYPNSQPATYDRNQPNQNYPGYQQQPYQGYPQTSTAPSPVQPPTYQDPSQPRPEAYPQNAAPQPGYPPAQPAERQQNTFSHHDTSAPVGGMTGGQPAYGAPRPETAQRQDPNMLGGVPGQPKPDQNQFPGYMQPPAGQPAPAAPQAPADNQVLGGFLGQPSNQPAAQPVAAPAAAPSDPAQTAMQEPTPGFQFNPDLAAQGGQPSTAQAPPPIDLGANADPSTMDIGALNRMAEYYATNSDYPKVRIVVLHI